MRSTRAILAAALAAALPACGARNREPAPSPPPHCGSYGHRLSTVKPQGARVDWSRTNGLVAYDRMGDDGYFDVYVMAPDGTRDMCLTCGKAGLVPQENNGNPAWHPSGNYIVFQSEVAGSRATPFASAPGKGVDNVLWITDPAGREFTQLTALSTSDPDRGVLHPHFSADGSRLSWSEMYEGADLQTGAFFGHWRLVVADFVVGPDGRPGLRNVRKFEPGVPGFYENHGFSPDGSRLVFSSNAAQPASLPALFMAERLLERAERVKVRPPLDAADGVGDKLFALVDDARRKGIDPEQELRAAIVRFYPPDARHDDDERKLRRELEHLTAAAGTSH